MRTRLLDPDSWKGLSPASRHAARRWLVPSSVLVLLALAAGCGQDPHARGRLEAVWGKRGPSDGRFQKPRAMAIGAQDHIYVVDMTARIQVFDSQGHFLHGWQTPEHSAGRPTGMSIARNGNLLVADTHYHRILIYSPQGQLLKTIGGHSGTGPGEFGLVSDVVEDSQGNLYVGEYGDCDRIQKLSATGRFLLEWGGHGPEPGHFARPQGLAIDRQDRIWVADAGNHRIQVFDTNGKLLQLWGSQGRGLGQLYYPYDLVLASDGTVYVVEYGNSRVQKFTCDGKSLGCWGSEGRAEGQLFNPWAAVCDSRGYLHVLDTNNHRVEKIRM